MTDFDQLLRETEDFVRQYFAENISPEYYFHDLEHTVQTVAATQIIGKGFELDSHAQGLLALATWFHDTGYAQGPVDHEERSCINADHFLRGKISDEDLERIQGLIRATKVPQKPKEVLQKIICDADLSHLGMESYWARTSKFRQELNLTRKVVMSDEEWVDFEIDFLINHEYHTPVAQELFNKRKNKHVQQLIKQKRRLKPEMKYEEPTEEVVTEVVDGAAKDGKEGSNKLDKVLRESQKELNMARIGRGVETMYRTTYRTHTNLSAMADSKANLMLSVNAIVISILASNLLPRLQEKFDWGLAIATICLTITCLLSMIYATLATRPKITEGKVTREAIRQRKANLLFFGNFYNMPLDDFQWGINEMLKDSDFLYNTMSRDLYFLGIVLAKKYRYLSLCYNIFMYGLIVSVIAFIFAFTV
ncbi:MAG: hypothetical protein J0L99_03745 [Chitinophagales bacterium]|nr:hypothetical protein [Chitinophagales bacterium]